MKWIAAISVLILVASLSTGFTVFAQTDRGTVHSTSSRG